MELSLSSGSNLKVRELASHDPLVQYCIVLFHHMLYELLPSWFIPTYKRPDEGSSEFFHEVRNWVCFVILLNPSWPQGNHVWVGWSKLCHKGSEVLLLDAALKTRFPLSQRTIWTELELMVEYKFVDQTGVLDSLKTTRLPSTILNAEENLSETGISLFATQTTILSDATFFEYHMPI